MRSRTLPSTREMCDAVRSRDGGYDGLFFSAVKTTGIFCRPSCPAKKPRSDNVEFFRTSREALLAGYRPCLRCRPLEPRGSVPEWLRPLLAAVEEDPLRRWKDADLRDRGIDAARVRRWFVREHGMTFHAYLRARRMGVALGRLRHGEDLTDVALDHGYESLSGFRDAFKRVFGSPPGSVREQGVVLVTRLVTPLGPMIAGASDTGVCLLEFIDRRMLETQLRRLAGRSGSAFAPGSSPVLARLDRELHGYFEGGLREFSVPLDLRGTEFQRLTWEHLRRIPYGDTWTYEQLARAMNRPGSARAVGRANGDNRIAIVVPCHRVIGSDGRLTGYGGGLWRKRALLELEQSSSGGASSRLPFDPENP